MLRKRFADAGNLPPGTGPEVQIVPVERPEVNSDEARWEDIVLRQGILDRLNNDPDAFKKPPEPPVWN
jgi:hypothetical protein